MADTSVMQKDWDERARSNALHYICSERTEWDSESFFRSGEDDYQRMVAPVLEGLQFNPQGKTALEIGCGVGRMTRAFASRFAKVYALDVSTEMLRRGQAVNGDFQNIAWLHGDGAGFSPVSSASVDFVFSYLVLQHVPSRDLALVYVREMLRVLVSGGVYCFQFNSCPNHTMNWKGHLAWGLIDRLREPVLGVHLGHLGQWLTSSLRWDGLAAGKTWRGAALPVRDVLETLLGAGGTVNGIAGWDSEMTWCYGHKVPSLAG